MNIGDPLYILNHVSLFGGYNINEPDCHTKQCSIGI
jgi:hypothetical protein